MNAILALKDEKTGNFILHSKNNTEAKQSRLNFKSIYTFFINQLSYFRKKTIYFKIQQHKSDQHTAYQYKTNALSIEISSEKMEMLLAFHHICAEDVRCLNATSKQCLQKLCLKTCLKNRHYNQLSNLLDNN